MGGWSTLLLTGSLLFATQAEMKSSADIVKRLNEQCTATGLESNYAYAPKTGKITLLTKKAYHVDGLLEQDVSELDVDLVDAFIKENDVIEMYHCHPAYGKEKVLKELNLTSPQENPAAYNMRASYTYFCNRAPSPADAGTALYNTWLFEKSHNSGNIRFFIVTHAEGVPDVIEYAVEPKLREQIRTRARQLKAQSLEHSLVAKELDLIAEQEIFAWVNDKKENYWVYRTMFEDNGWFGPLNGKEAFEKYVQYQCGNHVLQLYDHGTAVKEKFEFCKR